MPQVIVLRQNAALELARKTEEDSHLVRLLASLYITCDKCVAALSFAVCVLPLWPLRSGKNSRVIPEAESHGENYCWHPVVCAAFLAAVAAEVEQVTGCCRSRWDGDGSTEECGM